MKEEPPSVYGGECQNIFPYVALAWLVIGLVIVFASPALVRRIGHHLEESEGLHVEERAGPVSQE
jgi:hypothetical protein